MRMAKGIEIEIQKSVQPEIARLRQALADGFNERNLIRWEALATLNAARALDDAVTAAAPQGDSDSAHPGFLKKQIKARRSKYNKPGAIIGPQRGPKKAFYADWIVFGTKPHKQEASVRGKAKSRMARVSRRANREYSQTVVGMAHLERNVRKANPTMSRREARHEAAAIADSYYRAGKMKLFVQDVQDTQRDLASGALKRALGTTHGVFASVANQQVKRTNNFVMEAATANIALAKDAFTATITKLINDEGFRNKIAGLNAFYKARGQQRKAAD
jgi:hypothetical protein